MKSCVSWRRVWLLSLFISIVPPSFAQTAPSCTAVTNIATQGTASQSSNFSASFPASNAVNSNTTDFTHTAPNDSNATWSLDFASDRMIEGLLLHNRDECCGSRFRDIRVTVSNSAGETVYDSGLLNPENILASPATLTPALPAGVVGNRVSVQRTADSDLSGQGSGGSIDDQNVLSLGEVDVQGCALLRGSNEINLAAGRPVSQSSLAVGGLPERAVDGNTNGVYSAGSVTHTGLNTNAWWQVDLESVGILERIEIWNRSDCCRNRLTGFYVFVSETPFLSTTLAGTRAQAGVREHFISQQAGFPSDIHVNGQTGRFVRVQLAGTNFLSLAEVRIIGNRPPEITDPGTQNRTVGDSLNLQIQAQDLDGDALSYSATGLPTGLVLDTGTGLISGTPVASGRFTSIVQVTDSNSNTTEVTIEWFVGSVTVATCAATSNVALQGSASQSSNFSASFPASNAINGGTGDFSHTQGTDANATWTLNFNGDMRMQQLVLHNRDDCCSFRLRDISVIITNTAGEEVFVSPLLNPENLLSSPNTLTLNLTQPVIGSQVQIRRTPDPDLSGIGSGNSNADRNVLSLGEVQIQGCILERGVAEQNLASGKPVTQSGTVIGGVAGRAVDDNTNGAFSGNSVTHTLQELNAWWEVDITEPTATVIDRIEVWNRTDCCANRLSSFYVFTSDQPFTSTSLAATRAQPGVREHFVATTGGRPSDIHVGGLAGRYVRVQLAGTNFLSLAEVRVIGRINSAPVANGADQTFDEESVATLDASASSDADGSIASYQWLQTSGRVVTLADPTAITTTFAVPSAIAAVAQEVFEFSLTVVDDLGDSSIDNVQITARDINNRAPVMTSPNMAFIDENSVLLLNQAGTPFIPTASDDDTTGEPSFFFILPEPGQTLFSLPPVAAIVPSNFESQPCGADNICTVMVTPTDLTNIGLPQIVQVFIRDLNDEAPVITSPDSVSVDEYSRFAVTLTALDPDSTGEPRTFSISGGLNQGLFQLEAGADLNFITAPDFEAKPCGSDDICELQITASDGTNSSIQNLTVTINDLSGARITDAVVRESGTASAKTINLRVQIESVGDASIDYATADGTATVAGGDYQASSGTLDFIGGTTEAMISLNINADLLDEGLETFSVTLSNPSNAELAPNPVGTVYILEAEDTFNDTGIRFGANTNGNNSDCSSADTDVSQQDCAQGRDSIIADATDGHAGFSYTKIGGTGQQLPVTATSWSCVLDNVTGLTWEVKTDAGGLGDRDDSYSWYDTDSLVNGGDSGAADSFGSVCAGYSAADPATHCNTQAYIDRLNSVQLCGYSDWQLPSRGQLRSLVNLNEIAGSGIGMSIGMSIDTMFFPETIAGPYWVSESFSGSAIRAWRIDFDNGADSHIGKVSLGRVRAVRDGQ